MDDVAGKLMGEFEDARKTYDDLVASKGKALLGALFGAVFDACPGLTEISWSQYTPHFNDGDACEFSVHDRRFKIDGVDFYDYELGKHPFGNAIKAADDRLDAPALEDVFESTFGDHVEVTATRDAQRVVSFAAEEYEHD